MNALPRLKSKFQTMLRRRKKCLWFIDPSRVAFGSVVERGCRNVSRTHVSVRYAGDASANCIPFLSFVRRCQTSMLAAQPLNVEHLLVAPILKQRHASYFDVLTDWRPAEQRARKR